MNLNENATPEQLGDLLAEQDDDAGEHVLWVDALGEVRVALVDGAGECKTANARLVYAPFESGVGFVGEDAASDPELVAELMASLVEHWRAAADAPLGEIFIDLDDPESGPGWSVTDVATVDDKLLAGMARTTLQ